MFIDKSKIVTTSLPLAFITLSVAVIYVANQFPDRGAVGAHFFPTMISIGIIAFSIINIITEEDSRQDISDYDLRAAGIISILILGYVILMPITGFLVGTMIFLPIAMYYSNIRSRILILLISIILPVTLFYIFSQIFFVRLPEGVIPFSRLLPNLPFWVVS